MKQPKRHEKRGHEIKLAIIPPIAYLNDFSTDYHLVLAHLLKYPAYFNYYLKRVQAGDTVIMDNGAAEQGTAIADSELFQLAESLRPSILVCPDSLFDSTETISRTSAFLDSYARILGGLGIELMGVPQGKTQDDWMEAFAMFNGDSRLKWLGISKYIVGAFPRRLDALEVIKGVVNKKCHLLGMSEDVEAVFDEKEFPFVQSTDTAVPVKLGMQGLTMDEYNQRVKMSDDSYFLSAPLISYEAYSKVLQNIAVYKGCCQWGK